MSAYPITNAIGGRLPMIDSSILARCKVTSEHSVSVYDRPVSEVTDWHNQIIGTVAATPRGVEVHRPHNSLAGRWSASVPGEFATIGDGVLALIADYESGRTYPVL